MQEYTVTRQKRDFTPKLPRNEFINEFFHFKMIRPSNKKSIFKFQIIDCFHFSQHITTHMLYGDSNEIQRTYFNLIAYQSR